MVIEAQKDGLEQTGDLLKTSSGLVAGVLALSLGFLGSNPNVPASAKAWLITAWVILGISLFCSVLAYMVIPPKLAEKRYSLSDPLLNATGGLHTLSLLFGLAVLAVGVGIVVADQPALETQHVQTASQAIGVAEASLRALRGKIEIQSIELLRGIDVNRPSLSTWHIKFVVSPNPTRVTKANAKEAKPQPLDMFIDASDGKVTKYPSRLR